MIHKPIALVVDLMVSAGDRRGYVVSVESIPNTCPRDALAITGFVSPIFLNKSDCESL